MRHFFVSSFVVREYWGDEDALVIHMGMIVGMRGVSIRIRPLKGYDGRGGDDEKGASIRRFMICVVGV